MVSKLKKIFPYILVAIFVGWFCYKFFVERKPPEAVKMTLDWDQLDATSGSAPEKVPVTLKKEEGPKIREHSTLTESEEDRFEVFDEMEKKWLSTVQEIVGDQYPRYLEMRERNEKEKMQAYKEYHDYLRKQYGDNFSYNISEDNSMREKEINQRYLKELLALIGHEKFQNYIKARDKINEDNRKNKKEFIQVEF